MASIALEFLDAADPLRPLCERYWEIAPHGGFARPVREVAREFEIKQNLIIPLVNSKCNARVTDAICTRCGESPLFFKRTDYIEYQATQRTGTAWVCHLCTGGAAAARRAEREAAYKAYNDQLGAQDAQGAATLAFEREETAAQEARQRQQIDAAYAGPHRERKPADPWAFPLKYAVWFLSLVRLGASEDLRVIRPLASFHEPLAGSPQQDCEILLSLYTCGFIYVDPASPLAAFVFRDGDPNFYVDKVQWLLSDEAHAAYAMSMIVELESSFRRGAWASRWHEEVLELWRDVALQDCLEFLRSELDERGLRFNPGEKTILTLRGALEEFSPGQVCNMILQAARNAADFYMKGGVDRAHAANTVPNAIQRYVDRARSGGWNLKPFVRSWKYPQSMVSQVFFEVVLTLGDESMSTVPREWESPDRSSENNEGADG